jgi:hypothetical protein
MSSRHVSSSLALILAVAVLAMGLVAGTATAGPRATGWSIQPSPNPQGAAGSSLASVSCPGEGMCMAVGVYGTSQEVRTLAERWDGTTWTIVPTPNPAASSIQLNSVSCAGSDSCMTVGYFVTGSTVQSLAERWDGTSWTKVKTPRPPKAFWAELDGVSCINAIDCIAVGGFIKNGVDSQEQPLAEQWDGSSWRLQHTPKPNAENGSGLTSVSCTAATACEASGVYTYADVVDAVFAFGWDGTRWFGEHQPNPGGSELNNEVSASCSNARACTGVGTWVDFGGNTRGLAERWDGTKWTGQRVADLPGSQFTSPYGVSCINDTVCAAVGNWSANANAFPSSTLAERWNGTGWVVQPTPNPAGAKLNSLAAVDCTSPASCEAVGSSYNAGVFTTLVESYTG